MSLIAWYPLNGDTLDYSGNGYNASNSGATIDANGKIGKCYNFNGSSSRISTVVKPNTIQLSITMWVKSNDVSSAKMFLSSGQSPVSGARLYLSHYNGKWDMGLYADGWGNGTVSATTNWTFITLIMNNGVAKLYANGQMTRQISYTNYNLNQNLMIGSHGTDGAYYWNGKINDVRIYDHGSILDDFTREMNIDRREDINLALLAESQPREARKRPPDGSLK